jgi:LmbE family N-acetylglucosaminyl deacetylase
MSPRKHPLRLLVHRSISLVLLISLAVVAAQSLTDERVLQQERQRGVIELWEALTPLKSIASQMTTGAHPDDERSSLLALLSRGQGVRVITVTANRGEGGQNSIGTERYDALGVLRSHEMEEASQAFNVELYFLSESFDDPIYDWAFSKSAVETIQLWGGDVLMEKLVRVIRESRPDVIFTNFQDVWGQHGHHRAASLATEEAFRLAADPEAFPEQLEGGLRPWQAKKFYLPAGRGSGLAEEELPATLVIDIGDYDPIFGASYDQLGQQSRAYHRSQDMGRWADEGPRTTDLYLADAVIEVANQETSMFDGLPQTLQDLAELVADEALRSAIRQADEHIQEALGAYPDSGRVNAAVTSALAEVREARAQLSSAALDEELAYDLGFRLGLKEAQLQHAHRVSALLVPRLTAGAAELTRGATTEFTLMAFVGGQTPLENVTLELEVPDGWTVERLLEDDAADDTAEADLLAQRGTLGYNETMTATFAVTVAADAPFFHPYRRYMHPFDANSDIQGVISYESGGEAVRVAVDPAETVAVLPDLSIRANPQNLVYNLLQPDAPLTLDVAVTSYLSGEADSTLSVVAPEGWGVEPAEQAVSFSRGGDVQAVSFTLLPPEGLASGSYDFEIVADGAASSASWVRVVDYQHIDRSYMVLPATVNVQAFEVVFDESLRVGYVDSGVDLVPEALRRIGVQVELLSGDELTSGDLSGYDTIMVGVYGYRLRPDLAAANERLLEWVRNGGNLVVQYHRPFDNWDPNSTPPYFLQHGTVSILSRVTDHQAPVEFLAAGHPLLNAPNEITEADFDGWIKERGLYFPDEWAEEYTELFSITDRDWPDTPEETPFLGSVLTAELGAGRYTHTNLVLHLQIEENVPGAYRLYANLITPPQPSAAER